MTFFSQSTDRNRPVRFLSIGECMVEMASADAPETYRMGYAGDTFNTAWYLRALRPDVEVGYFSRVGTDAVSQNMLAMMVEAGIDTTFVSHSPDRSVGLYLISLINGERSFSYWRDRSAARQLAEDKGLLQQATQAADLVYFSGITLAILDATGRETLLDAMASARASGKTIAFDPNLRPRLWASTAEMTHTIMQAAAVSDMVLPSFDDEAAHFGDPNIDATLERYASAGATTVVVKNGPGTILYRRDGQTGSVTPPKVGQIVDSTSAGDSFNAAFFAGLDRGKTMDDLILAASQVAGQVIGKKGALVPLDRSTASVSPRN
ncbi:MAG: sugar kinase [Cypionkella sp.]